MANDIWAVTAYFNPRRSRTRKDNFDWFAARLRATGVKLVAIEMALPEGEFELGSECEVMRVRSGSLMWQKERLLNLAIASLPASCTKVAWLDGDILFENPEWLRQTSEALDRFAVVQPFSSCIRLPRGQRQYLGQGQEGDPLTESFAAAFARDPSLARDAAYSKHGRTGFAWAARRELLEGCGLYDACLTSNADHLMAHAFAGVLDSRCIPEMIGTGNRSAQHFERWATEAGRLCVGNLGYILGRVFHLWHGSLTDRRHLVHCEEFKTFDFDPDRHLRRDANGLWAWAEAPAELRAWTSDLILSRNDDGDVG